MTHVERVKLPGIGVLHKFRTDHGTRIGVVTHRSGSFDLVVYPDSDDDDGQKVSVRLDDDEARTLADLLGGTSVTEEVTALQSLPGLTIDWLSVGYDSACAGAELGNPQMGGAQEVSVVAVIRGENTIPSPPADFRIFPGDTLVAVGTPAGVARLFQLLQGGNGTNADGPALREVDRGGAGRDGEPREPGEPGEGPTG